jgi:methylase of polypeptide subunit release factors
VACAKENVERFRLTERVEVLQADLFPEGQADLVICNPPWLPAQPRTPMDRAIFDPDGRFLSGFLSGLPAHLTERGQGWLVISNLAELLGLRPEGALEGAFAQAGLKVAWTRQAQPKHPKAFDRADPLHAARSREVTQLYCLVRA